MIDAVEHLFTVAPFAALFVTIALGFLVGKLTIGRFVLGGIAGTLLVGVVIGQFGVELDASVKTVFFALFIYAVGYQGGPQFAHALNLRSLNQLASAFVMCVAGLACVIIAALVFNLDRGTAAGLAAGGLTQSAIIGTAGGAISKLDVSADLMREMETNVAVGYAVTYIFGSLGPILIATWFIPMIMKWDIRAEAIKLAEQMSGGRTVLGPGQFNAVRDVVTRFFEVSSSASVVGKSRSDADGMIGDAAIEAIIRDGKALDLTDALEIAAGDVIAVSGPTALVQKSAPSIGEEVIAPAGFELVQEGREIVLSNRALVGKELRQLHDEIGADIRHGVFLTSAKRLGHDLHIAPKLELRRGDELHFTGAPKDLDRIEKLVGYKISAAAVTDFVFFGLGLVIGFLLGLIEFKIGGVPVSIGTGGGCLLSGLFFGWLHSTHKRFAALPVGASNFLRDFGLAVFVGVVGISAGPQALTTLKESGLTLFFLGVFVTIVPQIVVFFFSYYVLRIQNPIEALGCLVGGRSANPGFAALLSKAGNATPVVSFTVTYAVANVFLTLWGPIIIGVVTTNPTP
ncbi:MULTISPECIES: aspartate-alanine antiporter [unclassified Ruegeria]|uniref:aspartate-alanine antiporter n=1 Tax=unclassified Ruegeria TaxID=2625375 RepID=UPI001583C48E|nr:MULTISPECIES: aspartate-alanine antiporter [unclassified Ruegeria]